MRTINRLIKPQVAEIAMIEATNAATKVVQKAIGSLNFETDDLMNPLTDENNKIIGLNYNTQKLNWLLNAGLDAATSSLQAAEMGLADPHTQIIYYDKGVIYSVALGYFTGIALFSGVGPRINVHMKAMHANKGEIQVSTTSYGINNTVVQIDLVLELDMLVVTPFLVRTNTIECRIPLVLQIVQGSIPEMVLQKIV